MHISDLIRASISGVQLNYEPYLNRMYLMLDSNNSLSTRALPNGSLHWKHNCRLIFRNKETKLGSPDIEIYQIKLPNHSLPPIVLFFPC